MQTKEILVALLKGTRSSVVTSLAVYGSLGLLSDGLYYNDTACYVNKNFIVSGPLFAGTALLSLPFWTYHYYKNRNREPEQQELLSHNEHRAYSHS